LNKTVTGEVRRPELGQAIEAELGIKREIWYLTNLRIIYKIENSLACRVRKTETETGLHTVKRIVRKVKIYRDIDFGSKSLKKI